MFYPTISNMWNNHVFKKAVSTYEGDVNTHADDIKEEYRKAQEYNRTLSPRKVPDAFSAKDGVTDKQYEKVLNIGDNGMMGYITIPSIDVEVPIYHYTNSKCLKKGAGHLPGSSLPIGGKGTHSVLSAHRGLPSAKLFTDLNLLKKGDSFYINVLDKTLKYEVDQILVVKPSQTDSLEITPEKDYVTLVTCTPYGVNTKRLLVRGHRVPYHEKDATALSRRNYGRILMTLLCIVAAVDIAYLFTKLMDRRRWKHDEKAD